MDRELKRGTLEMVILKLISEQDMYGYQLSATMAERSDKRFQIEEGTLYPILYRMEAAGYIQARWETPERGAPRKYYHLTQAGTRQLQRMIEEWQSFTTIVLHLLQMETLT
jgi:transcriptional regulator